MQNYVKEYSPECAIWDFGSFLQPSRALRWRGHDFHSEQDEELALMGRLVTFTSPKYFRKSRSVIVALSISLPSLFALLY